MQKIIMMITLLSSTTCFAFGGLGGLGSLGSANLGGSNKVITKSAKKAKLSKKKPIRMVATKKKGK